VANRFTAQYWSECGCGAQIEEGDPAGYVDDEIACATCCDDEELAEEEQWEL
jgi:hypothetical protein